MDDTREKEGSGINIPNEVLEVILGNLSIDKLKEMRLVCHNWNNIISIRFLRDRVQIRLDERHVWFDPRSDGGLIFGPYLLVLYSPLDHWNEAHLPSSIIQNFVIQVGLESCRKVRHFLKYVQDRNVRISVLGLQFETREDEYYAQYPDEEYSRFLPFISKYRVEELEHIRWIINYSRDTLRHLNLKDMPWDYIIQMQDVIFGDAFPNLEKLSVQVSEWDWSTISSRPSIRWEFPNLKLLGLAAFYGGIVDIRPQSLNMPKLTELSLLGNANRSEDAFAQMPGTPFPPIQSIKMHAGKESHAHPLNLAAQISKLATRESANFKEHSSQDFQEQGDLSPLPNVNYLDGKVAVGADSWLQRMPNLRRLILFEETVANLGQLRRIRSGQFMTFPLVNAIFLGQIAWKWKGPPCPIQDSTKLLMPSLLAQFPNFQEIFCCVPDSFSPVMVPDLKRLNIAARDSCYNSKFANEKELQINNHPDLECILFVWEHSRRRLNEDLEMFTRKFRHLHQIVIVGFCSTCKEQLLELPTGIIQSGCVNHKCRSREFFLS